MYCPRCGQQQLSDQVRYCSRCGFLLEGVNTVVASGGVLPAHYVPPAQRELSPRSKGVRQGAMLMLSTILAVPLVAIFTVNFFGNPEVLVPLTALFCFVGGLLRILYALIMEDAYPKMDASAAAYSPPPAHLPHPMHNAALPPAPVNTAPWRSRPNTAEIPTPPSVTENTTRLLDKDDPNTRG